MLSTIEPGDKFVKTDVMGEVIEEVVNTRMTSHNSSPVLVLDTIEYPKDEPGEVFRRNVGVRYSVMAYNLFNDRIRELEEGQWED